MKLTKQILRPGTFTLRDGRRVTFTAADVQRVARTYFTPENRLVITLMPSGKTAAAGTP